VSFATEEELKAACENVNGSFWHGRRITCIPRSPENSESSSRKHRNSPNEPTSQLFIGNIPYETTDAELNHIFRGMDNLKDVRVAVDRTTGWPRGFAHADFATVESAADAKRKLQGVTLGDRSLRIDFAQGYSRKRGEDGEQSSGRDYRDRGDRGDRRDRRGSRDNRESESEF
jgi:RNA recognition motif-containing protein